MERLRMEKDLCQDELDRRGRNAPIEMEPRASIATAIGGVLTPQPPEEIDPGRDAGGASPPPDGDTMEEIRTAPCLVEPHLTQVLLKILTHVPVQRHSLAHGPFLALDFKRVPGFDLHQFVHGPMQFARPQRH